MLMLGRPEDRGAYRHIPVQIMGAFHEPPNPVMVLALCGTWQQKTVPH